MADIPSSLMPSTSATPVVDASQGAPHFELLDTQENAIVKVPREQAAELLRSGLYTPKKGTYQVIDDAGDTYDVDSSQLGETLKTPGTRFETSDEQRRRESKEKYEHQPLRTFGESLASSATFGLSDQLLTKGYGVPAEEIESRQIANPTAHLTGEVVGVAAPLIATMGESALAKGVQAAGFGPSLAAKAGQAVEKQLAKTFVAEGASPTLAAKIASKLAAASAGSAVEGSLYGAGTLLSENALGRADINAENFLATVGPAALIGAGAGATLKGIELAANPILKFSSKQIERLAENLADKNSAALELLGVSAAKAEKLRTLRPEIHAGAADFLKNDLKLGVGTTADELAATNSLVLEASGQKIGRIINEVDSTLAERGLLSASDRPQFWNNASKRLRQFYADVPEGAGMQTQRDSVLRLIEEAETLATKGGALKAGDIHSQKMELDKLIQWGKQASESPVKQQALRELRNFYSETIETLADKASLASGVTTLADDLKAANTKFSLAKTFDEALRLKADKTGDALGLKTMVGAGLLSTLDYGLGAAYAIGREALKSDLKRKAVVLLNLEKAGQAVNKAVASAVKNFSKGVRTLELPVRTTVQSHVLSQDLQTKKKAADKQAAMRNIQSNLFALVENQEQLANRINRATSTFYKAAPETSTAMDAYSLAAVNFLAAKLPRKGVNSGAFNPFKKPRFSDMEIHKFEKYLEGVESPLKVIKKLEHGQVNREHIEALRAVYPQLYNKLQGEMMEAVSEKPDTFTYNQRVQLSILLDVPTDASLQPENIAGLQANFVSQASAERSGREGAVTTSQSGLNNLSYPDRYATESQGPNSLDEA